MREATKNRPKDTFIAPQPPTTDRAALLGGAISKRIRIDKTTGLLAGEFTPADQIEERTYLAPHDILFFLDKDDPLGEAPTNPASDPQFAAWETGVLNWIAKTNATTTAQAPVASSDQYGPAFNPTLTILEPANQSVISGSFLSINLETQAPRGVRSVSVRFADRDLGTVSGPSWNFGVTIAEDIPDGFYDLVITAKDDVGNSTTQTITLQLFRGLTIL